VGFREIGAGGTPSARAGVPSIRKFSERWEARCRILVARDLSQALCHERDDQRSGGTDVEREDPLIDFVRRR
jgi:hypothetical protein